MPLLSPCERDSLRDNRMLGAFRLGVLPSSNTLDDTARDPRGIGHDGQRDGHGAARWHETSVGHIEVGHVEGLAIGVEDSFVRICSEAAGATLEDLCRSPDGDSPWVRAARCFEHLETAVDEIACNGSIGFVSAQSDSSRGHSVLIANAIVE